MGGQASPCSTGFRRRPEQSPGGGCGDRHATCDWSRLDDLRVEVEQREAAVQAQYFAAQGMPVGRKLARSHERDTSAAHCSGENSIPRSSNSHRRDCCLSTTAISYSTSSSMSSASPSDKASSGNGEDNTMERRSFKNMFPPEKVQV
jgi:hypothetical protein